MTEPRRFSQSQRTALYLAADGRCSECSAQLDRGWHADHVDPWSRGGPTDVINGQALCPDCNLRKRDRVDPQPREWQKRFIAKYHASSHPDFLLVACPGAGKTLATGFVARDLLRGSDAVADRLLVVVPSAALRGQWMSALASLGIVVDGVTMNNGQGERATIDGQRTRGWVVTYQSLQSDRGTHRILNGRRPTVAILDEIHHLGEEASWGKAAVEALGPCVRRLGLSGTPFRGSRDAIPFVEFDGDGLARYRDDADGTPYPRGFDYSYGRALNDSPSPVRPILFDQYDGDVTWLEVGTDADKTVTLSDAKLKAKDRSKANRHVLDVRGDWLPTVLADADARLSMVQSEGDRAAKGLVFCINTHHAYAVSDVLARLVGRQNVAVAVSRDTDGRDVIEEAREVIAGFTGSPARWLVAVQMVSEGIDIPSLRVAVWATVVRSPLMFRQGMGRIIRRTRLPQDLDQTAYLFIPKDPKMVEFADEVYDEVKVALLEKDPAGGSDGDGPNRAEQLGFEWDAFRGAIPEAPSVHAPGLGAVDPARAAAIAQEAGQPYGAVVQVLAAMAKLGTDAATPSVPPTPAESYAARWKQASGDLEELLRSITKQFIDKHGLDFRRDFSLTIAKLKREVYDLAGIPKDGYDRADIPQLIEAQNAAKKIWADL